jgi:hypothetical protein
VLVLVLVLVAPPVLLVEPPVLLVALLRSVPQT